MKVNLPEPILLAQRKGIEYFMGEDCEWKLEIEESNPYVEGIVGVSVCIFANNGFGDFLFLKREESSAYEKTIFEFFHEGPEINEIDEELETLLGLVERPASDDDYPRAIYDNGSPVRLGDVVQFKLWTEFWRGWQSGVIVYVPGISNKKLEHEHGGLKWVSIKFEDGCINPLVDPKTGILRKIKFVKRVDTAQIEPRDEQIGDDNG